MAITNPGGIGVRNGQFLGLEVSTEESEIVILPLPWDVTTSYRPGTVDGPQAVIDASYQLDLYSPVLEKAWDMKLHTLEISEVWKKHSQTLRKDSQKYIDFLSEGGEVEEHPEMLRILAHVNKGCADLHAWSAQVAREHLKQGRRLLTLGGDHSVSQGPLRAAADHFGDISILHFDAHADLREAYEGFDDSHASIMFNALKHRNIKKIVQVGVRDVSQFEIDLIKNDDRIKDFPDWILQERKAGGESWATISKEIIGHLGPQVYISFDIDGLDPKLCPHTGTPVPGGLEFFEATSLIQAVVNSGRKIIGADLVEVAPGPKGDEWDGNVGARVLFQLATAMFR